MARIQVLGVGNVLMGDDALGPYAVRLFEARYEVSDDVALVDVGTPGLDLVPHLAGAEAVVFVDTVRSKGTPGEVRLFRRDEILTVAPPPRVSPHDPGLKEALLSLEFAGQGPADVLLVGVVPESTAQGVGMSGAVRSAVPEVEAEIAREIERLGGRVAARATPLRPDIWWER